MNEKEILELLLSKMTNVEKKVDNMENKISKIEHNMEDKISKIEHSMEDKISKMEHNMNSQFDNLQNQIDVIASEVMNVKTTLENETNKNMRVIAEGHENLNYKLDKAVQYSNKMEIMEIRINRLESEVEKLKKFA